MSTQGRTAKSLKNSSVAMMLFFFNLILQFFSRKVFLDYLGTDILGLNTTAVSFLQFLNLAEMGIASAVAFSLYKPLKNKNIEEVSEIISLQGWLYKRIGVFVFIGGVILMLFFPIFFKKMALPLWYAYATFGVLLFSTLLGYFYNYKQVVLSASQQEYKIQLCFRGIGILKVSCQMAFIACYPHYGYIIWLVLEALFSIFQTIALSKAVKRNFPDLKEQRSGISVLKKKYPSILTKIKQVFIHKVGAFVQGQVTPLIIYGYASLSLVTIYGNYMLIITGLTQLLDNMFNGLTASIGNLITEGNQNKNFIVFRELYSIRFWIIGVMSFCLWNLTNPFMTLWIGSEYVLPKTTLLLLIIIFFLSTTRIIVNSFIHAHGLFGDTWAPITEASISILISVVLGKYWGLNGILTGLIISLITIVFTWKPYYLFKCAMHIPYISFLKLQFKHIFILIILSIVCSILFIQMNLAINSWSKFIFISIILSGTFGLLFFALLYMTETGMRIFLKRMKNMLLH